MRWWVLLWACSLSALTELGVTYEFSSGRLGDNLLAYLHAKWVAYQKGIPLLYKPFYYSSQLKMDELEVPYLQWQVEGPRMRARLSQPLPPNLAIPVYYVCPYFPEDPWELGHTNGFNGTPWESFAVDWKDGEFRKRALEMVAPKYPLLLVLPPKERVSIALHYREGGGYDDPLDLEKGGLNYPLKFPPLSFYFEAVEEVLKLFPDQRLYCFLFTDAAFPEELLARFQTKFPGVEWNCRKGGNGHNRNVLVDFFSLFHFDALIHPQSNFSLVPALLHDYAVCCSPADFEIAEGRVVVTKTNCKVDDALYRDLLLR